MAKKLAKINRQQQWQWEWPTTMAMRSKHRVNGCQLPYHSDLENV